MLWTPKGILGKSMPSCAPKSATLPVKVEGRSRHSVPVGPAKVTSPDRAPWLPAPWRRRSWPARCPASARRLAGRIRRGKHERNLKVRRERGRRDLNALAVLRELGLRLYEEEQGYVGRLALRATTDVAGVVDSEIEVKKSASVISRLLV